MKAIRLPRRNRSFLGFPSLPTQASQGRSGEREGGEGGRGRGGGKGDGGLLQLTHWNRKSEQVVTWFLNLVFQHKNAEGAGSPRSLDSIVSASMFELNRRGTVKGVQHGLRIM